MSLMFRQNKLECLAHTSSYSLVQKLESRQERALVEHIPVYHCVRQDPGLSSEYGTRPKKLVKDKCSSLYSQSINVEENESYFLATWSTSVCRLCSFFSRNDV
jgi:hypothetical protein